MDYSFFRRQIFRLTASLLKREPLSSEIAYWSQLMGAGASLAEVSREIRGSEEFQFLCRQQQASAERDKKPSSW